MKEIILNSKLRKFSEKLDGKILIDRLNKTLYSKDASIYEVPPLGVVQPASTEDLIKIVEFAEEHEIPITPRTAGTSLAGQTVGEGLIIDQAKYLNKILEVNQGEKWVRVQPGVVRDQLNRYLADYGLFFGVNTSTSNRAMIGGMTGNNSSGSLSITYGTTRENVMAIKMILTGGEEVTFGDLPSKESLIRCSQKPGIEGDVYQNIIDLLDNEENKEEIEKSFPKPTIHRRNNGYAIDVLSRSRPFDEKSDEPFNFCKMLVGSEGTLGLFSEIKLKLHDLPPERIKLVCSHFTTLRNSLKTAQIALAHQAYSCELMDKSILDCTKDHPLYRHDCFFVEGDPAAIIITEFRSGSEEEEKLKVQKYLEDLKKADLGYAHPVVSGVKSERVWALRAAGLGLLANVPGDGDSVVSIEDTAVDIVDLPDYISELDELLKEYQQTPTYYAHAGAGELHVRPYLNLRKEREVAHLEEITLRTARLVKKYKGSLSGEHGDGRIRSQFIPEVLGEKIPKLFQKIKKVWDPNNIFNPGIKVNPVSMKDNISLQNKMVDYAATTAFDFSYEKNLVGLAGKCTGSGDCRKHAMFGGTMCPSFQATQNEEDSTRGRARMLFKVLTEIDENTPEKFEHRFRSKDLKVAMDLCLSCKGCTKECPSGVDMALMKSEYLYQKNLQEGYGLRNRIFAYQPMMLDIGRMILGRSFNLFSGFFSAPTKILGGIHSNRRLPQLSKKSLRSWFKKRNGKLEIDYDLSKQVSSQELINVSKSSRNSSRNSSRDSQLRSTVFFFCDEFTNQINSLVGMAAVKLLEGLGYQVCMVDHSVSGRTFISKGFLEQARDVAQKNCEVFFPLISKERPLLGVEPSAVLTFKDEYPKLLRGDEQQRAQKLSENVMLVEDFLCQELERGRISTDNFNADHKNIHFHAHCHQKSLADPNATIKLLNLPKNFSAKLIPSGCCGMAGSFGYEKEHYDVSQKVFNLVLKPYLEKQVLPNDLVVTSGISCHEQVFDSLKLKTKHPVEVLYQHLDKK